MLRVRSPDVHTPGSGDHLPADASPELTVEVNAGIRDRSRGELCPSPGDQVDVLCGGVPLGEKILGKVVVGELADESPDAVPSSRSRGRRLLGGPSTDEAFSPSSHRIELVSG
jgi:hypothetical protein